MEADTGKLYINGFDRLGRPVVYLRNYRQQQQQCFVRQIKYLIFVVEQCVRMMRHHNSQLQEQRDQQQAHQVVLLFDMQQYSVTTAPPMVYIFV